MRRALWLAMLAGLGCNPTTPADITIDDETEIDMFFEAVGPEPEVVDAFAQGLGQHPALVEKLGEHRSRLLNFHLETMEDPTTGDWGPGTKFRAVVYDYDANQAYQVQGDMNDPDGVWVGETDAKPAPPLEEIEEAKEILLQDPGLADAWANGDIEFYRAMPPVLDDESGDRVIVLGVRPTDGRGDASLQEEIAGINMSAQTVVHFPEFAPANAKVTGFACNPPPDAFQSSVSRGTQGTARLRMRRGGQELWSFTVTRPSASSGNWGAAVELTDVRYRGKRIFRSANMPLLNVRYVNEECGPYRDWQWEENRFTVGPIRNQIAPGLAIVEWAKTIRETADDEGNFEGVAAYFDTLRQEIVVISEIEAGWYRYMSEWRFGADGTIRPALASTPSRTAAPAIVTFTTPTGVWTSTWAAATTSSSTATRRWAAGRPSPRSPSRSATLRPPSSGG